MSLYIVTLSEMKSILGITDAQDDSDLTFVMEGVQARIDQFCRRTLLSAAVSEIFDGDQNRLYVDRWPIESVSEVVIDGDQDWNDPNSELDLTDDLLVNYGRGYLIYGRGNSKWPEGLQSIRVSYTGGLFSADADGTAANSYCKDSDIEAARRAMMMQARFEWQNKDTLGKKSISMQGASVNLAEAKLLPEVEQTLWPLRRIL